MNKLMKKKKKGFTLIELIAVIAILAILAVVAVPRVITYVEKSKKVAVQTEASTIYNAAEAAYNDGKLKQTVKDETEGVPAGSTKDISVPAGSTKDISVSADNFDTLEVSNIVKTLTDNILLNNVDTSKFGKDNKLTLADLKKIMNAKTDDINVSSDGVYQGLKTSDSARRHKKTTGK